MAYYISSEKTITAKPRSKRLQQTGATVVESGTSSSDTTEDPNSHTHANKTDLDKMSVKDGYVNITETTIDKATGKQTTQTTKTKSGYADNLSAVSTDWNVIARKDKEQTIAERFKFLKGVEFGDFIENSTGGSVWKDSDGNWHFESDYLHIRKKLSAESIEVQHTKHIGGKIISTAGSMIINKVETYSGYYRCYFKRTDAEGHTVYNTFEVNDLAYCETFNLVNSAGTISNHYWWRKVLACGDDYVDIADNTTSGLYESSSDVPQVGDDVSTLGNTTDKERQGALILAGAGNGSPYLSCYQGINSFTLPKPIVQISPNGTWITVTDGDGTEMDIQQLLDKLSGYIDDIRTQEDKQMVIWFGDEIPTTLNAPASDWTTDADKALHEHDIYYNRSVATTGGGRAYSWELTNGSYGWKEITDKDVLAALEAAEKAQDTADGKRRVFVSQPTDDSVYDVGDQWVNATYPTSGTYTLNGTTYTTDNPLYNNDVLRAVTAKTKGEAFDIAHWTPVSSVTAATIKVLKGEIDEVVTKGKDYTDDAINAIKTLSDTDSNLYKSILALQNGDKTLKDAIDTDISKIYSAFSASDFSGFQVKINSITSVVNKVTLDADGNISKINNSGVVIESNYADMFSQKISKTDIYGKLSLQKSGIITTDGDGILYSESIEDGIIKAIATISTFVTKDSDGYISSGIKLKADQIVIDGETTFNDNFKVLKDGSVQLLNTNATGEINATSGNIGGLKITTEIPVIDVTAASVQGFITPTFIGLYNVYDPKTYYNDYCIVNITTNPDRINLVTSSSAGMGLINIKTCGCPKDMPLCQATISHPSDSNDGMSGIGFATNGGMVASWFRSLGGAYILGVLAYGYFVGGTSTSSCCLYLNDTPSGSPYCVISGSFTKTRAAEATYTITHPSLSGYFHKVIVQSTQGLQKAVLWNESNTQFTVRLSDDSDSSDAEGNFKFIIIGYKTF